MSARALVVSAIASGQGKTSVTAALARRFTRLGRRVQIFKVGADFLDALVLERACGRPVYVLDLWMVGKLETRRRLEQAAVTADVVLIEGVMGLYDGTPSSADLARAFDLAVLAVIDVGAMAQTVGAVAVGLRDFGGVRLAGVVANRVASAGHRTLVAAALRDVPLIASLPRQLSPLAERHLGLVAPDAARDIETQLDALDRSLVFEAAAWEHITQVDPASFGVGAEEPEIAAIDGRLLANRRVAVARDAAFAFLYPANIDCLVALGAELAFFSPLAGDPVPPRTDAVFLPGGYPEVHAKTLSRAARFHESIRAAHAAQVPILAECGGMMALCDWISDLQGTRWPMAGIIAGGTRMQPRLAALGPQAWHTGHGEIRGHTFHYSTLDTPLEATARTVTHPRGTEGEAIYQSGRLTASYFHAYFPSCPGAIAALLGGSLR